MKLVNYKLQNQIEYLSDEKTNSLLITSKGGWHNILTSAGFVKRNDRAMYAGDVVICENAIGIFDGTNGLFAGRAIRRRNKLTDSYYLYLNY